MFNYSSLEWKEENVGWSQSGLGMAELATHVGWGGVSDPKSKRDKRKLQCLGEKNGRYNLTSSSLKTDITKVPIHLKSKI